MEALAVEGIGGQVAPIQFPATRSILWDHTPKDSPFLLSFDQKGFRLTVSEQALYLASGHPSQNSRPAFLVGGIFVDPDGGNLEITINHFDPGASLESTVPGDIRIPLMVGNGAEVPEDTNLQFNFETCLMLLEDRAHRHTKIDLSEFVCAKGQCAVLIDSAMLSYKCEVNLVTLASKFTLTPIAPLPVALTALSKNLGLNSSTSSNLKGLQKSGYVTMDQTRKLVLALESDPKVTHLPLVGIWVAGLDYVTHPYIWAACVRYVYNKALQDKVCTGKDPFILLLYTPSSRRPTFYDCILGDDLSDDLAQLEYSLHAGSQSYSMEKVVDGRRKGFMKCTLEPVFSGVHLKVFNTAVGAVKALSSDLTEPSPGACSSVKEGGDNLDDSLPRDTPMLSPHHSKMVSIQHAVPDVSLIMDLDTHSSSALTQNTADKITPNTQIDSPAAPHKSPSSLTPDSVPTDGLRSSQSTAPSSTTTNHTAPIHGVVNHVSQSPQPANPVSPPAVPFAFQPGVDMVPYQPYQPSNGQQFMAPYGFMGGYPRVAAPQHSNGGLRDNGAHGHPANTPHRPTNSKKVTFHSSQGAPGMSRGGVDGHKGPYPPLQPPQHHNQHVISSNHVIPPTGFPPRGPGGAMKPVRHHMMPFHYPAGPYHPWQHPHHPLGYSQPGFPTMVPSHGHPHQNKPCSCQHHGSAGPVKSHSPTGQKGPPANQLPVDEVGSTNTERLSYTTSNASSSVKDIASNTDGEWKAATVQDKDASVSSAVSNAAVIPEESNLDECQMGEQEKPRGMSDEVYSILLEQEAQLKALQGQIQRLLAQQRPKAESHDKDAMSHEGSFSSPRDVTGSGGRSKDRVTAWSSSTPIKRNKDKKACSIAVNTGKSLCIEPDAVECGASAQSSSAPESTSSGHDVNASLSSFAVPTLNEPAESFISDMVVDMPSYGSSSSRSPMDCGSESGWQQSPKLGESVSMYEEMNQHQQNEGVHNQTKTLGPAPIQTESQDQGAAFKNIIENVKTFLANHGSENSTNSADPEAGAESYGEPTPQKESPGKGERKEACQLGIDMDEEPTRDMSARDMNDSLPTLGSAYSSDDDSLQYLRHQHHHNLGTKLMECDKSMQINALAMKYLRDDQLANIAKYTAGNSPKTNKQPQAVAMDTGDLATTSNSKRPVETSGTLLRKVLTNVANINGNSPDVSIWGMHQNNMSFATRKYMQRYGLIPSDANQEGDSVLGDLTKGTPNMPGSNGKENEFHTEPVPDVQFTKPPKTVKSILKETIGQSGSLAATDDVSRGQSSYGQEQPIQEASSLKVLDIDRLRDLPKLL